MKLLWICVFLLNAIWSFAQNIGITPDGQEYMSIFFAGGSYAIDPQQKQDLHGWLMQKQNLHEYDIVLHSHTDNIGSVSYNQFLSRMRSETVILSLEEIMIKRDEIQVKDFGELNPLFNNETLQGRLSNRRVDIILMPPSS